MRTVSEPLPLTEEGGFGCSRSGVGAVLRGQQEPVSIAWPGMEGVVYNKTQGYH